MSDRMRDVREIIREEMLMRDKILAVLKDEPKTVPDIAAAIGYPSREVMFWVMGMRKYGQVAETGEITNEGYHQYRAVAREGD